MGALLQGAAPLEQEEVDGRRGAIGLTSEGGGISSNSQYGGVKPRLVWHWVIYL